MGRKRFRYGDGKRRVAASSLWKSIERFYAAGLRMAGFLHQFKTPLHVIQSQTELLLEDAALSPQTRGSLDLIQKSVGRLAAQTQSILDLSRGTSESIQVAPLGPLVEEICQAAQTDCRKKDVTIETYVVETAPIRMDRISLEGALHNLVNNAIEAMPKGGMLKITTFDRTGSQQTGVRIEDTGPGMDRQTLRKILQTPFQTSKSNGTGLGIYITRHILRRHRASMKWESKPGVGTKVTILFPAHKFSKGNSSAVISRTAEGRTKQSVMAMEGDRSPRPLRGLAMTSSGPNGLWRKFLGVFALLSIIVVSSWAARTPQLLRLQGRFTDSQTAPLTDNLPVHFSIWDAEDGYGNLMWQDVQNVSIQNNRFQVVLGRLTPLPPSVFSGGDRWLEMQVGNDAPLRPRHKIPSLLIQSQVAAPPPVTAPPVVPPPPAPLTADEKRQLEIQIDNYKEKEEIPVEPVAPKPPVKPVHHPHPKVPVQVAASEADGELGNVYTVQAGDTLKSIAQKLYGKGDLWYDLYYLNRDRLGPMGHLFPGQILVLPSQLSGDKPK